MATFSADIARSQIADDRAGVISGNVVAADSWVHLSGHVFNASLLGALVGNLPISELPSNKTGHIAKAASGNADFYNRILVEPAQISAGNVITAQAYPIKVWNGYFAARTLNSIGETGADGLDLVTPQTPPYAFAQLAEQEFTLQVSENGPAVIDAVFSLNFDVGSRTIAVTGQRIFAWSFEPDWSRAVIERLEWATDIIRSYDGSEQRIALRAEPRRSVEYQYWLADAPSRRKFEALVYGWGARKWLMPIWWEGQPLASTLAAGATSITLARVTGDWYAGSAAVIRRSAFDFEIVEVLSVAGQLVTFKRPTVKTWAAGTATIYPGQAAVIEDSAALSRFTGDTAYGICRMQFDADGAGPSHSLTLYRGEPVLTDPPVWARDLTAEYVRKLQSVDFRTGPILREDEAGMPFVVIAHHWAAESKAKIDALRGFFYARAGRQKMLWLPTFLADIQPVAAISSASTIIDVEHSYIAKQLFGKIGRRDIRIETKSGGVYYRRITAASELSDSVERISIDSNLPVSIALDQLERISWMAPARLDTDAIEIAWRHDDFCEISANLRTVRDDV